MQVKNLEIRQAARAAHVPLWAVAQELGVSEPTMTRKLRCELSDKDKEEILAIIKRIAESEE